MSFESYDEAQQQQQELTQTQTSPSRSSVFGSSSLGTLGSSAVFSPNAYTPPVVPTGAPGPLCVGEGAVGLPISSPPLMHNQQHSPSTLERLEQMRLLRQAQMLVCMQQQQQQLQQQQQQQQAAMSGAPGFGAIGAERARRDSHTSSSGVSGSGASYNLLASAAAAAGLDSSFTQLLKLESAAAASVGEAHEQLCYTPQSCFESHLPGTALQPQPMQNGLGLSSAAALRIASGQWPVGDSSCTSDPRALGGQQHF